MSQADKDRFTGKEVKVRIKGRLTTGIVRGRLLPFAEVWIPGKDSVDSITFSWEAIERAVDAGAILKA